MLYGVGLGPGDRKLMTIRAVEVIKAVDEVIVPGKMAYDLVKDVREPRIVEFPMGSSEKVAKDLAAEIAERDDEVAFCCLGDPMFYSTFHHVVEELLRLRPDYRIEIVPGVSSISAALAKAKVFVSNSVLITTQNLEGLDTVVVLKAKKPAELERKLREQGFTSFVLLENMFMEGEKICTEMPERASYFSVLIAGR